MRQKIRKGILTLSALLFPLSFVLLSPYIIIMSAANGLINASAVVFAILFLYSVIGSRLFCGWLCPCGAVQDQISASNNKAWNSKAKNASKYIIWVIWFSIILFLWIKNNPHKLDFFYLTGIQINMVIIYFMVIAIVFIFSLCTGKRGMCHSFCWMAPFMIIGEKIADFLHIPRFRLKADSKACISCGKCSRQCPMSLNVEQMVKSGDLSSAECISCLECVDNCPKKAITCGVRRK